MRVRCSLLIVLALSAGAARAQVSDTALGLRETAVAAAAPVAETAHAASTVARDTTASRGPTTDRRPSRAEIGLTLLFLFLYVAGLLAARWHHIARSLHAMIDGQLIALSARLKTEVDVPDRREVKELEKLIEEIRGLGEMKPTFWQVMFWSRGRENAAWVAIHEMERQLAAFLSPPGRVDVYLRWAEAELRTVRSPVATSLADAIRASLDAPVPDLPAQRAEAEHARKALLGRAIAVVYTDRDMSFSTLMEWQNKANWLILAAVVIVSFLTIAAGHAVLFLAGAAGGFLSRLMRALRRDNVPLDYGASWTTLFLSPLFGAMIGWFGIALITLATDPRIGLLGGAFAMVHWDDPFGPATLGIAFLLGFSERLFDAVVGAIEKNADAQQRSTRAMPAAAEVATPVPPREPAPEGGAPPVRIPEGARGVPSIARVVREERADGAEQDALVIEGTNFAPEATARVNGEPRRVTVRSETTAVLALDEKDLARLAMAGDFDVEVVNPDGAASRPYDVN